MTRYTGFSKLTKQLIINRAIDRMGYEVCEICGVNDIEEIHHRRTRGMGGTRRESTNSPANGIGCCRECHSVAEGRSVIGPTGQRIRGSRLDSYANGWLLRQTEEPTKHKVLTALGWELFDDMGHRKEVGE